MIELNDTADVAALLLRDAGGVPYVVGGAVRDALLKRPYKDIDLLVTGLDVEDILRALPGSYLKGEAFGVVRWRYKNDDEVEIAMPRTEVSTGPGHRDFSATVGKDIPIELDLGRRDYTVNAMAWDIYSDKLIDLFDGHYDVIKKRAHVINPQAFKDDPLRILRGFVLVSRYGFWIDNNTLQNMQTSADRLVNLPAERIQEELDKIFEGDYVDLAVSDMIDPGVMKYVIPELAENWNYNQNNPHHQQVLGPHQLSTLRIVAQESTDPDLRMAALLHDIGKPASAWVDPVTGSNHFYRKRYHVVDWANNHPYRNIPDDARWIPNEVAGFKPVYFEIGDDHEIVGARMAHVRLTILKYTNNRTKRIVDLIRAHMWAPFTSEKGARKFLNRYGDLADDLLILRLGDNGGKRGYHYQTPGITLDKQRELLRIVREKGEAIQTSDLAINGHDLIEAGFEPGPNMGKILAYLTDEVVDNPEENEADNLISLAKRFERNLE